MLFNSRLFSATNQVFYGTLPPPSDNDATAAQQSSCNSFCHYVVTFGCLCTLIVAALVGFFYYQCMIANLGCHTNSTTNPPPPDNYPKP